MRNISIKEIHADGSPCLDLVDLVQGRGVPWTTIHNKAEIIVEFTGKCSLRVLELRFWAVSFADKIRIYAEIETPIRGSSWKLYATEASAFIPDECPINRMVQFKGPFPVSSRLKIELREGHIDPFYQRYRIGIGTLHFEGDVFEECSIVESAVADQSSASSTDDILRNGISISERKAVALFAFPEIKKVLDSVEQRNRSPWKLLTVNSTHKQKLTERSKNERHVLKYILPRYYPPTDESIPSKDELNRLNRFF
jgi:hypothetical protein